MVVKNMKQKLFLTLVWMLFCMVGMVQAQVPEDVVNIDDGQAAAPMKVWDSYPTYQAYENMMYAFETDHPDTCQIITLGTLNSNRKLMVAHINNGTSEGKPKFFYISTIHGDETTGWILMLRLIDYILNNPEEPEVKNVLDNIDLYILPNMNPDGTYHGGSNTVNGAQRYNANNVDLNRNFQDPHGSAHPDGNQYQAETQWMMQFAREHKFTMAFNYHGGAEVFNYPWDNTYTLHADDDWFQLIGHEYADLTHQVNPNYMTDYNNGVTNGAQWYMIGGGMQDYMTGYTQCRHATIECSEIKKPSASTLPNYWNYNKNSIFALMNQCLYGIHGTVKDAANDFPIEATVKLVGHDDEYSYVTSNPDAGDFHRPVKAGTYDVVISAQGYFPYETEVTVADGETVNLDVKMTAIEGILANFSQSATEVPVGGTVDFTDESWGGYIVSWQWEFEGGTPATSTEKNPTVTYNEPGQFTVRLTITNSDGETAMIEKEQLINVVELYTMHEGSVEVADGMFYDDGGPDNNYSNNQDVTMTFLPSKQGAVVEMVFEEFVTESNWDFLYIYDGNNTNGRPIGTYSGTTNPGTVTASNRGGALTIRFTSDNAVNESGWKAHVYTVGGDEPPTAIETTHQSPLTDNRWYTLDGRALSGKPTARGIYIHQGRKVIIK